MKRLIILMALAVIAGFWSADEYRRSWRYPVLGRSEV